MIEFFSDSWEYEKSMLIAVLIGVTILIGCMTSMVTHTLTAIIATLFFPVTMILVTLFAVFIERKRNKSIYGGCSIVS
ncbi:MAG: hypothetical protein Q8R36_02545 [bacterium]|nr:hypothetical protein [bacterium]